ncbi:MAG: M23 family metallopeptidase, partial [Chloroflexia bacterium]|nr:M23 family metallopeptidase [Chloroflexia bacterium]
MKRLRYAFLLVPFVLAALFLLQPWSDRSGAGRPGAACAAPPLPLPRELGAEEPAARAALQAALERWAQSHPQTADFQLQFAWGREDWAAGEVALQPQPGGATEGTLLLARRGADGWQAAMPGEPAFADLLDRGPADYLPPAARDWFLSQSPPPFSDTQGLYYIPYAAGSTLLVTCVDCYPGHYPSVDFYSGLGLPVHAARGGVVAAWDDNGDLCCCQSGCSACTTYLVLDHGDGEYSAYLHLASGSIPEAYRQLGAVVPRGARIAAEGDTGYTCGSLGRPPTGCAPVTPDPGCPNCARHTHFEVRDAPYPYGQRLRPRFQDIYEQTDPPTYYAYDGLTYVSGNEAVTPTATPTPSPAATAARTPTLTPP